MGYFDLRRLEDGSYTKPGIRGYPGLDPMQELLLEVVQNMNLEGIRTAFDVTARGGAVALQLARRGIAVWASDPSMATFKALEATALHGGFEHVGSTTGLAFDPYDLVTVILPGDRGNNAVREHIADALRRLAFGGRVLVAGDKNRGFDRYFKEAIQSCGTGEILERSRGLRVGLLEKTRDVEPPSVVGFERFVVEARGQQLQCATLPGVFSSGKLDAASRLLLEHLPNGSGRNVLDIGSGYGALSGFLALEGARVTMLEDDVSSVLSSRKMLELNSLPDWNRHAVRHSDVDSALESSETFDLFDLIVTNPPFHVGSDLILDVALEFIRCAERRLTPGGEFWLVANHFLPYERELARIGTVREVARDKGFKVLSVRQER